MEKVLLLDGPLLDRIEVSFPDTVNTSQFPFSVPLVKNLTSISFPTQVTFFVGENGAGKSTILEAIAHEVGFGAEGGSKHINFKTSQENHYYPAEQLAQCMKLSWRLKPKDGYFFRAETFYNIASFVETLPGGLSSYGGMSLHEQSHGESFLSFFKHRVGKGGFFIFDEPEAALSPQRQLTLLSLIHQLCKHPHSQFIIATHSPLLLSYPSATIYSCDTSVLTKVSYEETEHYQLTKGFLANPQSYFKYLFDE